MIKFLLLVLAFNLIGFFLERMKRNAQKKKQMEYDGYNSEEEESLPPPVNAPEDILGDLFKKLETPTNTQPYEREQDSDELEEPVIGKQPAYHEYNAKEFAVPEHTKQEHEKMRDGRGLIELMEAKQHPDEVTEPTIVKPSEDISLPKIEQHRTSSVGRSKIRVNLRQGMILKEILGAPRGEQPWSI
jgi:hypothetical protein